MFKKYVKKYHRIYKLLFISISLSPIIFYSHIYWINGYKGFNSYRSFNSVIDEDIITCKYIINNLPKESLLLSDPYTSKIVAVFTGYQTSRLNLKQSNELGYLYNNSISEMTYNLIINDTNYLDNIFPKSTYLIYSTRTKEWIRRANLLKNVESDYWKQIEIQSPQGPFSEGIDLTHKLLLDLPSIKIYKISNFIKNRIEDLYNFSINYDQSILDIKINDPFPIYVEFNPNYSNKWYDITLQLNNSINLKSFKYMEFNFNNTDMENIEWLRVWFKKDKSYTYWNIVDQNLKKDQILININNPSVFKNGNKSTFDYSEIKLSFIIKSNNNNKINLEIESINIYYYKGEII